MIFHLPFSISVKGIADSELQELEAFLNTLELPNNAQVSTKRSVAELGSLGSIEADLINLFATLPANVAVDLGIFITISTQILKGLSIWQRGNEKRKVKIRSGQTEIEISGGSNTHVRKIIFKVLDDMKKSQSKKD